MMKEQVYDCIIIGAGPGGLQAAIYLGRYNRKVLIIDRGGGRPAKVIGEEKLEALEMQDGKRVHCEVILSHFGYKLNNGFLSDLPLKKNSENFKYLTSRNYESSVNGLYIVGPLTGDDQVVIAAGEGAIAAIDMKKRLLEM